MESPTNQELNKPLSGWPLQVTCLTPCKLSTSEIRLCSEQDYRVEMVWLPTYASASPAAGRISAGVEAPLRSGGECQMERLSMSLPSGESRYPSQLVADCKKLFR